MRYDFDQVIDRRGTYSYKADSIPEGFIHLGLADMDFQTAEPVIEAIHRVADFQIFGYSSDAHTPEFAEAICFWWEKHFRTVFHPREIIYTPGVLPALSAVIEAFTNPGDGVIIQRPVYGPFTKRIERVGRHVADNHLLPDGQGKWQIDFEDLEKKWSDPMNNLMILCSPANPVGRVWSPDELREICRITEKHGVLMVSDEIHCDIRRKGVRHTSIWEGSGQNENLIMISGINKSFNVAGLEPSFVTIREPRLRARFRQAFGFHDPNPFAIAVMIAAYREGEEWLEQVNSYIDENMLFSGKFFRERMPWLRFTEPEGTYCLWTDWSETGLKETELEDRIQKAGVVLSMGKNFDPASALYTRFCIASPRSRLREAYERLAEAFSDIKEKERND